MRYATGSETNVIAFVIRAHLRYNFVTVPFICCATLLSLLVSYVLTLNKSHRSLVYPPSIVGRYISTHGWWFWEMRTHTFGIAFTLLCTEIKRHLLLPGVQYPPHTEFCVFVCLLSSIFQLFFFCCCCLFPFFPKFFVLKSYFTQFPHSLFLFLFSCFFFASNFYLYVYYLTNYCTIVHTGGDGEKLRDERKKYT